VRVEVLPLHLGLQLVLLVGEQVDLDEGVAGAAEVLGRQLLRLHDLDGQSGLLEVVADAELDAAQVLPADAIVALVILRARGELWRGDKGGEHSTRGAGRGPPARSAHPRAPQFQHPSSVRSSIRPPAPRAVRGHQRLPGSPPPPSPRMTPGSVPRVPGAPISQIPPDSLSLTAPAPLPCTRPGETAASPRLCRGLGSMGWDVPRALAAHGGRGEELEG